jgi:ribosomal-protein-alanine N-acetyltransferase
MKDNLHIDYKFNSSTQAHILRHLEACKNDFIPSLEKTVNIEEYSFKIRSHAETIEAWNINQLIGLIAIYLNDEKSKTGFITNVSVEGQYKGKKIASTLINNCFDLSRKNKFDYIKLEVGRDNIPAVNLYKKYGFSEIEKKGQSLIMLKPINPNV